MSVVNGCYFRSENMIEDRHTSMEGHAARDVTGTIEYRWDDSVRPATAVIEALAAATNRDPLRMPPLQHVVEVGSLNTLVQSGRRAPGGSVQVTFAYEGHTVTVESSGEITIELNTDDVDRARPS